MDPTVVLVAGGLVLAGLLSAVSTIRTRQAFVAERERALGEAREEVRRQVGAMADEILALSDRVELAEDPEAARLFAQATAAYQETQDHLERSTRAPELEDVADELDHARWELAAAEALAGGQEVPPEPDHDRACFFDPTHGAGTYPAEIDTPAGRRQVRVCSYCAAKLRSGVSPEPRMLSVGGRRVPAAKAPRSYGGGGMDWLEEFDVVLDGTRRPYGWRR
jgi:phosphoglycolate phosphatase-like HAD superfamily hydrolase